MDKEYYCHGKLVKNMTKEELRQGLEESIQEFLDAGAGKVALGIFSSPVEKGSEIPTPVTFIYPR